MTRDELMEKLNNAMQDVADQILWARADDLLSGEEDEQCERVLIEMSDLAEIMGM